jgi:steroid delta-isomerase-like uncharacterized protein
MTGKTLVRRFYDEAVNEGRDEVFDDLLTPDFTMHSGFGGDGARGPDAVRANLSGLRAAFTGLTFDVADVIGEDDRVAARWTMRGTHTGPFFGQPASGRPIEQRGMVFYRVAGDRLAELWILVDAYGLFEQIRSQVP